eukprot:GEMP01116484.1.p1 GENE.GEMP01116484.1~~GEMP01116484.1.p1  ORF type:complete len:103 (-),score=0.24 GEMP01116484.1:241-549(-)
MRPQKRVRRMSIETGWQNIWNLICHTGKISPFQTRDTLKKYAFNSLKKVFIKKRVPRFFVFSSCTKFLFEEKFFNVDDSEVINAVSRIAPSNELYMGGVREK